MNEAPLNRILAHFTLPQKKYRFKGLHQGFINDTYLVVEDTKPKYILQRINHLVFKDVPGLMGNIDHALHRLNAPDYTRISLVKTTSGMPFCQDSGYWRLMTYIEESTAYNTTTDVGVAFEAGRIIGKFHQLLEHTNVEDYVDTIPRFHDLEWRKTEFWEALEMAQPDKLHQANEGIIFAKKTLQILEKLHEANFPVRICHNDTKLNNILFSTATQKALCLIDLDTLMKGYFYYDFGDAIRTVVNPANEDEKDLFKIRFDPQLFTAFVEGLQANGAFLTQKEIDLLPLGAAFMPFIHGLRALTDYLNNNRYYKVAYENQNLDRALSLFNFTEKALREIDFMRTVLKEKLLPLATS
ncbi:aminoglycoside phosphotransferase family protein [Arenibacter sp. GZD96]|uniref:phosphotransferase enzyme family protein n=1 Tax=Aurantibrevibacter litoralis TaxID=3106030 RepID=UPI002AFF6FCE|nr:aminoglycoside phosphotransferase family protein [Arenibacter sp. GZD-96]MEA1784798.1 aminoglycoside phosphotransferase family protein [Arenibacter sp. GZD-96]